MRSGAIIWRLASALLFGGVALLLVSPLLPPPDPGELADDSLAAELVAERDAQELWLRTSPTSALAATRRVPFNGRVALSVGTASDNDVRLEGEDITPHHLRITLRPEGYYALEAQDPEATLVVKGSSTRTATFRDGTLLVGRFTLSLSPTTAPVLLVSDPLNPRREAFKGLRYFPIDRRFRVVVSLLRDDAEPVVALAATQGTVSAQRRGWFEFTLEQTPVRLEVHRLLSPTIRSSELVVLFRDETTGTRTSALGRQVEPLPLPDGRYMLDFNRAVHSACALSEHYQCALPPEANTLPVAITAGERLAESET